ncbi:MAG: hypothetical protein K6E30_06955 [Lachnospiraceae bacterium]|nr:hypothetical protein [Lachnospiraceae bacterium]
MDTGLLRNNYTYYEGFEGEDEVVFTLVSNPETSIHLWIGYLDDILGDPPLNGSEWTGLTRDYHQTEGAFSSEGESVTVDSAEYLTDLQQYAGRVFDEPETAEVFQLIMTFLKYAVEEKSLIKLQVN